MNWSFLLLTILFFSSSIQANTLQGSINSAGLQRTFVFHTPQGYKPNKLYPLLIALHGNLGTGINMAKTTNFDAIADCEGFIVVYPDGIDRSWNDGRRVTKAAKQSVDDVQFISDLIDHFQRNFSIDACRIYSVGMSNGAKMTYRVACELPNKISAAAAVAGSLPAVVLNECASSQGLKLLIMHGTDDPIAPFKGGSSAIVGSRGVNLSIPKTVGFWAQKNNCQMLPRMSLIGRNPNDGTSVSVANYFGCKPGKELIVYSINGGGHTWPGGDVLLPAKLVGVTSNEISASEVIWNFFSSR